MSTEIPVTHTFGIKQISGFIANQPLEGHIACPANYYSRVFVEAIDDLGERAQEGIIGVLPAEFGYIEGAMLPRLVRSGVVINALLTFGATHHKGTESHLDIVARELNIPFCLAKRPLAYRGNIREYRWMEENHLRRAHGKMGSLALSKETTKISLTTTR